MRHRPALQPERRPDEVTDGLAASEQPQGRSDHIHLRGLNQWACAFFITKGKPIPSGDIATMHCIDQEEIAKHEKVGAI